MDIHLCSVTFIAIEENGLPRESWINSGIGAAIGVRSETSSAEGRLPATPERYAAFLVRIAVQRRRGLMHIPKSARAVKVAEEREKRSLKPLLHARGF